MHHFRPQTWHGDVDDVDSLVEAAVVVVADDSYLVEAVALHSNVVVVVAADRNHRGGTDTD